MENKTEKAAKIFKEINEELKPQYKGKIVAIDADSEDYFIGDSEIEAYEKAVKKHPNKQFIFKRIGFASTHFIGLIE